MNTPPKSYLSFWAPSLGTFSSRGIFSSEPPLEYCFNTPGEGQDFNGADISASLSRPVLITKIFPIQPPIVSSALRNSKTQLQLVNSSPFPFIQLIPHYCPVTQAITGLF